MRKARLLSAVIASGVMGGLLTAQSRASTIYSYYYLAGQNSYTVAPGTQVIVPLYLEEVNNDQSANSLLASEHGLSAAGVRVALFSGSSATITGATANAGTVPTGFDDPTSTGTVNSITSATISESTDPFPFGADLVGVEPGTQISGISQVYLGTVTIHAGAVGGQTTVFTIASADPNNNSTFTNDNNYDLDNSGDPLNPTGTSSLYFSAASTNFSVTTTSVPEPGALTLLTASAIVLMRRRKGSQAKVR